MRGSKFPSKSRSWKLGTLMACCYCLWWRSTTSMSAVRCVATLISHWWRSAFKPLWLAAASHISGQTLHAFTRCCRTLRSMQADKCLTKQDSTGAGRTISVYMARHWVSLPAPVESCLVGHLSACLLLKYHMSASTQLTCTSFAGFALLWHHLAVAKRLLGRVALYKTMQCADRARTCHRSPAEPGYSFHLILVPAFTSLHPSVQ